MFSVSVDLISEVIKTFSEFSIILYFVRFRVINVLNDNNLMCYI